MTFNRTESSIFNVLAGIAVVMVIIAGLAVAKEILTPFLLAMFVAIIASAPMNWLQEKGTPVFVAFLLVFLFICLLTLLMVSLMGASVGDLSVNIPIYEAQFKAQVASLTILMDKWGVDMSRFDILGILNADLVISFVRTFLNGVGNALTNGFLILMTVAFMLIEGASFSGKLNYIANSSKDSLDRFDQFTKDIRHYMAIKTLISLMTGLMVGVVVALFGVDYPLLWGILAFLLNYIPNVGSMIAACPTVLLAMVQFGLMRALFVMLSYIVINIIMGNVVEPRWMGKGLGISPLVVFLSLLFWGWIFGPVGMLLSVPLTVCVTMALNSSEQTRWVAILLGPSRF